MTGRVLVTGATGFLGWHVLDALADEAPGIDAVALVRDRDVVLRSTPSSRSETVVGRLEDADRWGEEATLGPVTTIIHTAALVEHSRAHADAVHRVNVDGTLAMVRLAARLGARLVAVSTSGTVGCSLDPADAPDEDAPFANHTVAAWPYYASKIAAERAASALAGVLDVELVHLRPPVLLGPGNVGGRSSAVLRRMLARRPLVVDGGYHFSDVRDAARAAVRAALHPHPRPVYHLPGWSGTLTEFARMVANVTGRPSRPRRIPAGLARLGAQLLHPFGAFVDPVLVEMARHHWGLRSRWSEAELGYRSRDPRETIRDAIAA